MTPIKEVLGRAYPLGRDNVDTDIILPGRFLKTITRSGLASAAFESIRAEPGNIFENPVWKGAPIVIAGQNFGCGSSREHAVWAMMDLGIRAVIAESYSDIFSGNAFKNGMVTITQPRHNIVRLLDWAQAGAIAISLLSQTITFGDEVVEFQVDPFRKDCLLKGLDEIGLTLGFDADIAAFEQDLSQRQPWIALPL